MKLFFSSFLFSWSMLRAIGKIFSIYHHHWNNFPSQCLSRVSFRSRCVCQVGNLLKQDGNLVVGILQSGKERCCVCGENACLNIDYENYTNEKIKQHLHIYMFVHLGETCLLLLIPTKHSRNLFFITFFSFSTSYSDEIVWRILVLKRSMIA